jgi:hypothetical protein
MLFYAPVPSLICPLLLRLPFPSTASPPSILKIEMGPESSPLSRAVASILLLLVTIVAIKVLFLLLQLQSLILQQANLIGERVRVEDMEKREIGPHGHLAPSPTQWTVEFKSTIFRSLSPLSLCRTRPIVDHSLLVSPLMAALTLFLISDDSKNISSGTLPLSTLRSHSQSGRREKWNGNKTNGDVSKRQREMRTIRLPPPLISSDSHTLISALCSRWQERG